METKKVVLFAGIGRLGIPVAERLVEKNWRLAISYRAGKGSEDTVKDLINKLGPEKVFGIAAQISDVEEANRFVDEAFQKYGRIDALIGIASHFPREEDWKRWESGGVVTEDDWRFYNSNFTPIRNTALAVLKKFKENPTEELNIINFSDAYTLGCVKQDIVDPYIGTGKSITEISIDDIKSLGLEQLRESGSSTRDTNPYNLSKRDISYLTRKLAADNQGGKVRVNAIAPGPMLPPPDMTAEEAQPFVDVTLLKRWGYAEPIVKAIEYLLDNSFITGEIHRVDGGAALYKVSSQEEAGLK